MRKIRIILLLLTVTTAIMAQKTLSGTILSKTDGDPIEMATVRLFAYNGADSTLVQGAQTYDDGLFILSNIRPGKYKLIVSSVGFNEHSQMVEMKNADLDLPSIRLAEQVQHLAEVSVQGRAAEMTVKGDTIEYNTAAYQVSETATVEELLKKMNGVEVDKEGNVTINGEEIKGVRIDGKKFFGDDVQTATKNIPADMIEKIQVIDEKSEMAKLTGFEDDETERIINLSLKKERKKGVFGKILVYCHHGVRYFGLFVGQEYVGFHPYLVAYLYVHQPGGGLRYNNGVWLLHLLEVARCGFEAE